jgi:hypothetical protein
MFLVAAQPDVLAASVCSSQLPAGSSTPTATRSAALAATHELVGTQTIVVHELFRRARQSGGGSPDDIEAGKPVKLR